MALEPTKESWPLVLLALAAEPPLPVRNIYGGVPEALLEGGRTLADVGVKAVWYHSGSLNHSQSRGPRLRRASSNRNR